MLLKTLRKSKFILLALIVAFCATTAIPDYSFAASRKKINPATSEAFMRRYCAQLNVDLTGLQNLLSALYEVLANLQAGLGNVGIQITPPQLCMPDINFGASISTPDMSQLMSCLGSFSVSVTTPDFSNVGSCLSGLIPNISGNFNFDPTSTLNCLNSLDISLDIPNIRKLIESIQRLVSALMSDLIPKINARLDANFFAQVKILADMCRRAGLSRR